MKRFGDVVALDGANFSVASGRIVGFLGPNGAGKTTTMRAIFGLVRLDRGEVRWRGKRVGPEERARFGYMPEERGLYPKMKVGEQLTYFAELSGMSGESATEAAAGWLERLDLSDRADARLEELSHGNQQRVQLAAAIVHDPELAVLDEPFSGLDPLGVESLAELLKQIAAMGVAVVFSSHQLDLVEDVCEDVVIIDHGRIVMEGVVEELKAASPHRSLEVTVNGDPWVPILPGGTVTSKQGGRLRVLVDATADVEEILATARQAGEVTSFSLRAALAHRSVPGCDLGRTGRMNGVLKRVWLVTRREWNQRARTRAFRISTLISIGIVVVLIMAPEIYGGGDGSRRTIGLVGASSSQLPEALDASGDQLGLSVKTREFADESAGRVALLSEDVSVLLVDQARLVWKAEPDEQLQGTVISAVGVVERQRAIEDLGLTSEEAHRLLGAPELRSTSLQRVTEEQTARADLGRIGVVLLFMAIAFYCGFVLVGVVEEKSSRVVEVLLSRVRPTELFAGKILGIGLVGLAQFALVVVSALVALSIADNTLAPDTTPSTLGWIVFWFVLGYAFYAVLYAAAGSLVSRQEETQSLQLPMTGVLFLAYVLAFVATESPDGAAALLGSFIPPTAPMVMIVRIAHGPVPWWQIVLSVGLMVATIYGIVQVAGRIYAGGVLRFGGRVRLKEAWRGAEP